MSGSRRAIAFVCVLVAAATGGCSRLVDGSASARPGAPLPQLLIDPDRFPVGYRAVVLDPAASEQALRDVDGVPAGSTASPPNCAPPAPLDAAAIVGSNGRDSLTVAVSHAEDSLSVRRDQLAGCPTFTVNEMSISATVLAAPPVAADDTYAVRQMVSAPGPRETLTLVAQLGDVRVTASATSTPGEPPDTVALDGLFSDAVSKTRHGSAG